MKHDLEWHVKAESRAPSSDPNGPAAGALTAPVNIHTRGYEVVLEVSGCALFLTPAIARGYADLLRACADRAERP